MMDEATFSGYCRCLDQSRIVMAEQERGKWFVDCSFGDCPYEGNCSIAQQLRQLVSE